MHTSTSTDSEIACFLAKRDKRAISLLYANYSPVIYGIIRKMIPHDEMADDIMQDVFVKIWENADKYDARKGRLFTWLAQITRNTTIDWLRSASYARKMKTCNLETTGDIPVAPFSIQDSGLKMIVQTLNPSHRLLIDCVYFKGYSLVEISTEFSMPLGTVKTRIRAAIQELRRILSNDIAIAA